jgi:hypothetical protein|tara:strand:+ start:69 stop:401 length:333 start_codon:yes stop_codon:yes gene_type:complete
MGKTLINPKNQKTYGGDDPIPDENYYNGVFFSNPALAQMFRDNKWSTTLKVGTSPDEPEPEPEPDPDSLLSDANSSASTEGGGYGKKRLAEFSRREMDLTGSKGSSILTS